MRCTLAVAVAVAVTAATLMLSAMAGVVVVEGRPSGGLAVVSGRPRWRRLSLMVFQRSLKP